MNDNIILSKKSSLQLEEMSLLVGKKFEFVFILYLFIETNDNIVGCCRIVNLFYDLMENFEMKIGKMKL